MFAVPKREHHEIGPAKAGHRIISIGIDDFEVPNHVKIIIRGGRPYAPANPPPATVKRNQAAAAETDTLDDDEVFGRPNALTLRAAVGPRAEPRTLKRQAQDTRGTREAASKPLSRADAACRRADLLSNARELGSQQLAKQTDANYGTALNWWALFTAFIAFPTQVLRFAAGCDKAVRAVNNLCFQFLQYTHRCIGQHLTNAGPPAPGSSVRYWKQIVKLHARLGIHIDFTNPICNAWLAGAKRVQTLTFGARPKKKKAMFSLQHISDLYAASWAALGGKRNPARRLLVLRAAPQLAIQVLFRASEYLRSSTETFNHNVHLSRNHVTYHSWDWSHEFTPEELTPTNLRALLASGKARALVAMPRLKNDQFLDREFPPTALELGTGDICALRFLLLMEIDDPLLSTAARQAAPMFVDPDTGLGLSKQALRNAINALTLTILTSKYARSITLKEIQRQWSLHSFRVTGQNLLRQAGAQDWQIRQAGRWLSSCALRYDRANLQELSTLSNSMSNITTPSMTHLTAPGMVAYPYPIITLHPTLVEHHEASQLEGPGTFTLSAESQSNQYYREKGSRESQLKPETQQYLHLLEAP